MATKPGGDKITRNIVIGMVAFVVAIGAIFSYTSSKSTNGVAIPSIVSKAEGYGVVFNGDLKGVPTVDLWEDFQCPICGEFETLNGAYMQSLISQKKAKVVFHLLSFLGPESIQAANAAACAADEDKFLAFHAYLYAHQSKTENSGLWSAAGLLEAGKGAGLTSQAFTSCVKDSKYGDWVNNVAADGGAKNVNQTPTVFVNGTEINRNTDYFNAAAFKKVIEG
ncbi:MAG: thioredoxin domain-containing protein [Actinobacteria bacterium]|uniref:Unannotated protein n=1 Tax=freshwater metagenome TaxID=449393 RepID=A0A6J7CYL9_9ZZZZ|nr:thioredoxin domain-containing protein [Actinomycetota bacterium]MSW47931.1 thioredoxin domain-containing protein [Actinomycetota bacterium]MSX24642.1 thioredoxin domain-containing protein [Actinomycetota bacterium]MSY46686.1 thioredoxin domain-containing protein [Actinomycetota bacterium]MSY57665.1 thioredoxin domain-containing protein [Actinomycetota bacterium]